MLAWFRFVFFFFFQAEDGIRDYKVTGVQTCALPISFAQHADGRRQEEHGHGAGPSQRLPEHDEADQRQHAQGAVRRPAEEARAIGDADAIHSIRAALAWSLMSDQIRSTASRYPVSACIASVRGRFSGTTISASTRSGRRDSTTTRSAM